MTVEGPGEQSERKYSKADSWSYASGFCNKYAFYTQEEPFFETTCFESFYDSKRTVLWFFSQQYWFLTKLELFSEQIWWIVKFSSTQYAPLVEKQGKVRYFSEIKCPKLIYGNEGTCRRGRNVGILTTKEYRIVFFFSFEARDVFHSPKSKAREGSFLETSR